MSVINTNITSLIGQQNLMKSQNALQTSMERLSSGLRINSAKDDAAGQAVANRMSAQITGLGQAQRNANDGISVSQTAEGALNQVNDNLQRIRELTVQAQNGTNSQDDLKSIQAEIGQRLNEINRISEETDFNGTKVLAKDETLSIQVGANDGETIDISLQEVNAESLNLKNFTVDKLQLGEAVTQFDDETALSAQSGTDGTIREVLNEDGTGSGTYVIESSDGTTYATEFDPTDNTSADTIKQTADSASGNAVDTKYSVDGKEYVTVKDSDGNDKHLAATTYASFTDGSDTAEIDAAEAFDGAVASSTPLASLDSALKTVDSLRSDLGAIQNRFESAITNLSTTETNLSAARSRIEDADYAVEVANMTRAQILQQAGTSVLAQANQVPQSVLSLLG